MKTKPANKFLALAATAALGIVPAAHAAVIASTNFNSGTESAASETMTGITWTGDDLVNVSASTTASYVKLDGDAGSPENGFFTTTAAVNAFAPDLNVQNEGDWAATFSFDLQNDYTGTMTTISFAYTGLQNTGAIQTGSGKALPFFVTVNGNAFDIALLTSGTSNTGTLSFTDTESLVTGTNTVVISTNSYTNSVGHNWAIDDLTFSGSLTAPVPEPSAALLGGIGFLLLLRRRR